MSSGSPTDEEKHHHDLLQLCEILEAGDSDTLRCLYEEYSTRRRHRGAHIWTIGAIFIPLSVSGAAALNPGMPGRTLAVAAVSIVLIWIWFCISETLRHRIDSVLTVCAALETVMLKREPPLNIRGLEGLHRRQGTLLGHLRVIIAVIITIVWLIVAATALPSSAP
jgi:hypothetical protein